MRKSQKEIDNEIWEQKMKEKYKFKEYMRRQELIKEEDYTNDYYFKDGKWEVVI